jgi:hypothetical protein
MTGALVAAIALVPGVALADEGSRSDPLDSATSTVEGTLGGAAEDLGDGAGGPPAESGTEESSAASTGPASPAPEGPADGSGASELDPAQLWALLEEAGVPADCADGLVEGILSIVEGLTEEDLPALEELLAQLEDLGALEPGGDAGMPPLDPSQLSDSDLAAELEALFVEFEECLTETPVPAPPTDHPAPPADQPAPPSPVAPVAVSQPASYPGYAPTGAEEPTGTAPLAVVGGALVLLGGAGAAAHRVRSRAVRDEG